MNSEDAWNLDLTHGIIEYYLVLHLKNNITSNNMPLWANIEVIFSLKKKTKNIDVSPDPSLTSIHIKKETF